MDTEMFVVIGWEMENAPCIYGVFTSKDAAIEHATRVRAEGPKHWFFVEVHGVRVDEPHQPDATPVWES